VYLVVHFLDKGRVFDAVGLKELDVSNLESLTNRLSDELGLKINHAMLSRFVN
jgi:hypothetical protein